MKKLYRKGTVHPSPPIVSDHLSFLPAAILTLAAALSPEDKEVLAYLISFSSNNNNHPRRNAVSKSPSGSGDHSPLFNCRCFRCYTNYWVRWDSSSNRQLIHEIIDAFEEWLQCQNSKQGGRKEKRNKRSPRKQQQQQQQQPGELTRSELVVSSEGKESGAAEGEGGEDRVSEEETEEVKGSVRRLVSFIGERIWGAAAWGGGQ